MMEGGGRSGSRLRPWPSWGSRAGSVSPSFFSISFSRLVKNFTKRNFIFPSYPTRHLPATGQQGYPTPGSSSNTYVPITFSFCLQKSSAINCLCVGKPNQKCIHGGARFTIVENKSNSMRIERQKFLCIEKIVSTITMKKYIMVNKIPGGDS